MKRSEKLSHNSRHHAWLSVTVLMVSVAIGACGVPTAFLSDGSHPGGWFAVAAVGTLALAILGLVACIILIMEAVRLARLSRIESRWETEREIRPKL